MATSADRVTQQEMGPIYDNAKRKKFFNLRPRLDHKAGPLNAMPPTIDPINWTPLTTEQLQAHNERQEIKGRLRRHFWSKRYHPVNYKFWNPINSDPAMAKFLRARSVWHMSQTFQPTKGSLVYQALAFGVALPVAWIYFCGYRGWDPARKNVDKSIVEWVREGKI